MSLQPSQPPAQAVVKSSARFSPRSKGLERWLQQRPMRRKISIGYIIALGIACGGTLLGVGIGNFYEGRAQTTLQHALIERRLFNELQIDLLHARHHQQQLAFSLYSPEAARREYQSFRDRITESIRTWGQLKHHWVSTSHGTPETGTETHDAAHDNADANAQDGSLLLLQAEQDRAIRNYFHEMESLTQQLSVFDVSLENRTNVYNQLIAFGQSPTMQAFDSFILSLESFGGHVEDEVREAEADLIASSRLRVVLVLSSVVLSMLAAIGLVVYTSRAISRPLESVTQVAKQVTENDDFELRTAVMTQDEIGTLANAFNQLIDRVQQLLAEQEAAIARERQMQESQLMQNEKMSSLGRMMAGIAHEINNPVNFVYGNITHAEEYIHDLFELIHTYERAIPKPSDEVADCVDDIDLEFIEDDLPKMLQSMKSGADRVRQIVLSLKNFSRLDDAELQAVNLHDCLASTLLILNNRIKQGIHVEQDLGDIPSVEGFNGPLYQVFMNLLSNALDALQEKKEQQPDFNPTITITTERVEANQVAVRIKDNGSGIPADLQAKIFENFFTTKPQGIGTGLGLALSRQIVEEKHHGQIQCCSEPGKGTTFSVILPIHQVLATASSPTQPQLSVSY